MDICYIVGALKTDCPFTPDKTDMVIAADAGYTALNEVNIKTDLVVGDFDSLGSPPEGETIIRHPVMKDDTDMLLAVKQGLAHGYRRFHLYGGLGGRTDHTIANIQTLAYIAENGGRGYLFGNGETMTVIKNAALYFPEESQGVVSVFAMGDKATGVFERGLLYSLTNAVVTLDFPVGVSNEFTGQASEISVRNGILLVIWTDNVLPEISG